MYVKPNRPTPDIERGGYLVAEGRSVDPSPYWMRRLADGDVSEVEAPVDPPPDAAAGSTLTDPAQSPPPAGSSVSETRKARSPRTPA